MSKPDEYKHLKEEFGKFQSITYRLRSIEGVN
jgi:hypothetical protein